MGREHGRTAGLGWAARAIAVGGLAACWLAACGGNVVVDNVDDPGTPAGTGGGATGPTTTTLPTTTSIPTTTTGGPTSTPPGSGSCSSTCAEAFTNGTLPCYGLGFALYSQLNSMACGGGSGCGVVCNDNLCAFAASTPACTTCVEAALPDELQTCLAH